MLWALRGRALATHAKSARFNAGWLPAFSLSSIFIFNPSSFVIVWPAAWHHFPSCFHSNMRKSRWRWRYCAAWDTRTLWATWAQACSKELCSSSWSSSLEGLCRVSWKGGWRKEGEREGGEGEKESVMFRWILCCKRRFKDLSHTHTQVWSPRQQDH